MERVTKKYVGRRVRIAIPSDDHRPNVGLITSVVPDGFTFSEDGVVGEENLVMDRILWRVVEVLD